MLLKKLIYISLFTRGLLELLTGVIHFVWPYNLMHTIQFVTLPENIREFLLLASLAIGLCLIVFAALSFYFSGKLFTENRAAWFFCLSQVFVWLIRLILEIIYPVRVSIYFIEKPGTLVLILIVLMIVIYLIPALFLKKTINS